MMMMMMMAREWVKMVIVTQARNSSGGAIGERYGEIPTAWTTPLLWNFTADIISLMLTLVSCFCLFRLAGDVIASTCLTIHTFACSSVTKLVNLISWKQMNWICCKFGHGARDEVVNFGGQKVKGQGHSMLKLHLEACWRHRSWLLQSSCSSLLIFSAFCYCSNGRCFLSSFCLLCSHENVSSRVFRFYKITE